MLNWDEFATARPDLAQAGRDLFYQFGVGLAFLATVRKDGGPRTHPMCPLVMDGRLLAFIVPSPKSNDLRRDGRFAMHSFPAESNEDAFYVTGRARRLEDSGLVSRAGALFWAERSTIERPPDFEAQTLFEFLIESVMLTRTTGHGDPTPQHMIWKA